MEQAYLAEQSVHGGHFNISINTVNQSPNANSATRKHTFKRVKRILDSSADEDSPPLQLTILAWLYILSSHSNTFFLYLLCENS